MANSITPRCGGGGDDDAPRPMPHLDDGTLSEILYRLPTKDAYRVAAVSPWWRTVLSLPTFLSRHLSPRPLALLDDRPYALVIQPRRNIGYFTHLTLVPIEPADRVPVNVPLQLKYMATNSDQQPCLLDTARDDSVFQLLYSTGTDDPAPAANDHDDADLPVDGDISSGQATTTTDASAGDAVTAPPLGERVEDYVVFFERTVPMLDISIVASHGRLLLGCSRSRYYVCDPAANRWLALPPSTIAPVSVANTAFHYDVSTGLLAFTVVLLVRRRRQRVRVETFRSATGRWDTRELAASGAARCLGTASHGIHVGNCFYWLSRRRGRILRYDTAHECASVLREPAEADRSKLRVGRSLGSVGGRLRVCAVDVRNRKACRGMERVIGVWLMDEAAARPLWRRVHEAVLGEMWEYYLSMPSYHEKPVDFAGASGGFVVVEENHAMRRYDLETAGSVHLATLQTGSCRLRNLLCVGSAREVALVDRRPRLDLRRGDIVIFRYDERKRVCSRLIALPGDQIKLSDTEEVRQVPEGHFWVEGDNSARSWDSRNYGPVPLDLMHGRVTRTIWPLHRFRPLHAKVSASQEARVIPTEMQKLCHTRKGFATISLRIST